MSKKFYFAKNHVTHPAEAVMYVVKGAGSKEDAARIIFDRFVESIYFSGSERGSQSNAYMMRDATDTLRHVQKENLNEKREKMRGELKALREVVFAMSEYTDIRTVEVYACEDQGVINFANAGFSPRYELKFVAE